MLDLALFFKPELGEFDLALADGPEGRDLRGDDGLLTAVIISLFTDARAREDDDLPDIRPGLTADRRGWWGDGLLGEDSSALDGPLGSRLWLLSREKDRPRVVARAGQYAREALAWLLDGGYASKLEVTAERVSAGYLGLAVRLTPAAGGEAPGREWNFVYDYQNAAPVRITTPGL